MSILNDFFTQLLPPLEETLKRLLPAADSPLFEAAQYSFHEGKRLRPLLTLAVVATFDGSIEQALQPACALEMIHTYSLIHDDLPCMDDDDFRRNRPSLHKAFAESTAVLTGDCLLTYAFEVLAEAPGVRDDQKLKLISTLAHRSGAEGMIGGQVLDIAHQGDFPELATLIETYEKKTGALLTAALEFGAILSNQPLAPFQEMGHHLGLAYQIVDDWLDQDGAVALLGEEYIAEWTADLCENALAQIAKLGRPAPLLEELVSYLIFRDR